MVTKVEIGKKEYKATFKGVCGSRVGQACRRDSGSRTDRWPRTIWCRLRRLRQRSIQVDAVRFLRQSSCASHRRGTSSQRSAGIVLAIKQAVEEHAIKDLIACVEMTGTYHRVVWRALREAGLETQLVHPFASNHYRMPEHADIKTDDNDLIAVSEKSLKGTWGTFSTCPFSSDSSTLETCSTTFVGTS